MKLLAEILLAIFLHPIVWGIGPILYVLLAKGAFW
jgi:hypothetical protein